MSGLLQKLKNELKSRNIAFSFQRLKILEYLAQNLSHPTVDQIFTHLLPSIPTLSKTTVYNTLRILIKVGLVRVIAIEEHEARYDVELTGHGHFKCDSCGRIFNFSIDIDAVTSDDLNQFEIKEKNVNFWGICPGCKSMQNNTK